MKKLLSLLLSLTLILGCIVPAAAQETEPAEEIITEASEVPETLPAQTEETIPAAAEEVVPADTVETVPEDTEEAAPAVTEETVSETTEETVSVTVADWAFLDPDEILTEGTLTLYGVSEENPVDLETVISMLPQAILSEEAEIALTWSCLDFIPGMAGEFIFTAALPEGYVLREDAAPIQVTVLVPKTESDQVQADTPELDGNLDIVDGKIPLLPIYFYDQTLLNAVGRYDDDGDNCLSPSEIAAIRSISLYEPEFLDGIEYLTSLATLTVEGKYNHIYKSLDISKPSSLKTVTFNHVDADKLVAVNNPANMTIDCDSSNIKKIDISGSGVTEFSCSYTSSVGQFVATGCPALTNISLTNLKEPLVLTGSSGIQKIYLDSCLLETLDVSNLSSLETLELISGNVKHLNLGAIANLRSINIRYCPLESVDVSHLRNIEYLQISGTHLMEIHVPDCPNLQQLYVDENRLQKMTVGLCPALTDVSVSENQLTALDLSGATNDQLSVSFSSYDSSYLVPTRTVRLQDLPGKPDPSKIDLKNLYGLKYNAKKQTFTFLNGSDTGFYFYRCQEGLDSYGNPKGMYMCLTYAPTDSGVAADSSVFPDNVLRSAIQNKDINSDGFLSAFELNKITYLDFSDTNLKSLSGIEHFNKLESLDCSNTPLTSVDVTQNANLGSLILTGTKLTDINLKNNAHLTYLDISEAPLKSLNVSANTQLKTLYLADCELTKLDVSKNIHLQSLSCSGNHLPYVDLSNNPELTEFYAYDNVYFLETETGSADLATAIPGFVFKKASNFRNAIFNGTVVSFDESSFWEKGIFYTYQCSDTQSEEFEIRLVNTRPTFKIAAANMTLGNTLAMHFYVKKADLDPKEDYCAKITMDCADGRGTTETTIPQSMWSNFSDTLLQISFNNMAAKEMADRLTIQIFYEDGRIASEVKVDSIRDYAMRMMAKPSAGLKTALVDMLNYGALAQKQFKYNLSDPANNQLTAAQQDYGTKSVTMTDRRVKDTGYAGSTLKLENRLMMDLYFTDFQEYDYAYISYVDHTGAEKSWYVNYSETTQNGAYRVVTIDKMVIADCAKDITCKIYTNEGVLRSTVVDSPESYCARMQNKGPIYEAIIKFSTSAYNYLHNR